MLRRLFKLLGVIYRYLLTGTVSIKGTTGTLVIHPDGDVEVDCQWLWLTYEGLVMGPPGAMPSRADLPMGTSARLQRLYSAVPPTMPTTPPRSAQDCTACPSAAGSK